MSKHLVYYLTHDSGSTKTFDVRATKTGTKLATIKWFGRWRQYAMFPEPGTVWNKDCLEDVNRMLARLMEERTRR